MEAPQPLIQPLGSDETWTDENGTLWARPTAWAYAQACRALRKHQDEFLASLACIKADRLRVQELSLRMIRASGKLMLALAGGTNSQSAESLVKEAEELLSLSFSTEDLIAPALLDEKASNVLRVRLKKKEEANEKLGKQLQEALTEAKRLSELCTELEIRLAEKRKDEGSASPATHQARYEARQHLAATITEPSTRFAEELPPMADQLESFARGANIALLEKLLAQCDKNVRGGLVLYRQQIEKRLQREKRGRGLQAHDALERRLFIDRLKSFLTEHGRSELKDLLLKIEDEERDSYA